MPSVGVKLYSVFFKLLLKHRLQNRADGVTSAGTFGVTSRPAEETVAPPRPTFADDGVATKDIHIDPLTALSVRIFLPDPSSAAVPRRRTETLRSLPRRHSYGGTASPDSPTNRSRRSSCDGQYRGYLPSIPEGVKRGLGSKKLPIVIQFHGGAFVSGSADSAANDYFCRRIAKLCDAIVVAVGYRLAPESRYPAAFEDGLKVLYWLGKQANLAECGKSMGISDLKRSTAGDAHSRHHMVDTFGASMVEPWLAAHGDPTRCVLLGVSCGANIADYVARKAIEVGNLLDPVRVVAQVLMYPFFIGSIPTQSELRLANSYFYDKSLCLLAWKLFLPEEEFSLDHPAANPLVKERGGLPLKCMPPTLTVVAEHDWMKDRAIAYSEELRKVNVDAPVLEYKDAVHEFATLDMLLKTPQAQACAEDIAIWVKKYISTRGHEFSY